MTDKTTAALKLAEEALLALTYTKINGIIAEQEFAKETLAAIREALAEQEKQEPDYVGWYCAHCERGVDGSEVTFHEQHEVCGRVITDDVPPKSVKQEPVAFKFPREPKPENAMGWTVDYGLIRDIAEAIGDQEFHPGYEGIELTLIALERIYASPVSLEAEWIETNKALAKEIIEQRNQYLDMLAEAVDLSVKAEREACAKVCDEQLKHDWNIQHKPALVNCAAAIRARGEK